MKKGREAKWIGGGTLLLLGLGLIGLLVIFLFVDVILARFGDDDPNSAEEAGFNIGCLLPVLLLLAASFF